MSIKGKAIEKKGTIHFFSEENSGAILYFRKGVKLIRKTEGEREHEFRPLFKRQETQWNSFPFEILPIPESEQ